MNKFPLLIISYFAFLFRKAEQSSNLCFRMSILSGLCIECISTHYHPQAGKIEFDSSECLPRNTSIIRKEYFITNSICANSSPCNGSEAYPFDSLAKALTEAHLLANKYLYSEMNLFILGPEHYVLYNSILDYGGRYFKRINVSISLSTLLCSTKFLPGCFSEFDAKSTLILKTDVLFLFVANKLNISRITVIANDVFLLNATDLSSPSDCGNQKRLCCKSSSFSLYYLVSACGLRGRDLYLSPEKEWGEKFSLINLEPFFESAEASFYVPSISIVNCSFNYIFPGRHNRGWIALISAFTSGGAMSITFFNTSFSTLRFLKGILWIAEYKSIYEAQNSSILSKIEDRNIDSSQSQISIKNVTFGQYDFYNMLRMPINNENSLLTISDFSGYLNLEKIEIKEQDTTNLEYSFLSIYRCLMVTLKNIDFSTFSNLTIIEGQESSIKIESCTFSHIKVASLVALNYSNFDISSSIFINITGDPNSAANVFDFYAGNFKLTNCNFLNSSGLSFSFFKSEQVVIQNSSLANIIIFKKPTFKVMHSSFDFQLNNLTNITEAVQSNFISIGNSIYSDLIFKINKINISAFTSISVDSCVFYVQMSVGGSLLLSEDVLIRNSAVGKLFRTELLSAVKIYRTKASNILSKTIGASIYYITNYESVEVFDLNVDVISNIGDYLIYFSQCTKFCTVSMSYGQFSRVEVGYSTALFYSSSQLFLNDIFVSDPVPTNTKTTKFIEIYYNTLFAALKNVTIFYKNYSCIAMIYNNAINSNFQNFVIKQSPESSNSCKAIFVFQKTDEFYLKNASLTNIRATVSDPFMEMKNGIINLLGFTRMNFRDQHIFLKVVLDGIEMINCGDSYYGLIGISNVDQIYLSNIITFIEENERRDFVKGGVISVTWADEATIENVTIWNYKSIFGGVIYLFEVYKVKGNNLTVSKVNAFYAGSILLDYIVDLSFSNIYLDNTSSSSSGGALSIRHSNVNLRNILIYHTSSKFGEGGAIYIQDGNISLNNITCVDFLAAKGGFIFAEKVTSLEIDRIDLITGHVGDYGLFSVFKFVNWTKITNFFLLRSQGRGAYGTIYTENNLPMNIVLQNITLDETEMERGCLIISESNDMMDIAGRNITFKNLKGSLIELTAISKASITIESILIENCSSDTFIKLVKAIFIINGTTNRMWKSQISSSFISALSSNLTFYEAKFECFASASPLVPAVLLNLIDSNIYINNISYNVSNGSLIALSFLKLAGGIIKINNSMFDSCYSQEFSCLNIISGDLSLSFSSFVKSLGYMAGSIYISSGKLIILSSLFQGGASIKHPERDHFLSKSLVTPFSIEITVENNKFDAAAYTVSIYDSKFLIESTGSPIITCYNIEIIIINSCDFKSGIDIEGEGLLLWNSNSVLEKSTFYGLRSHSGAALKIKSESGIIFNTFQISSCTFEENEAEVAGAILIIGAVKGTIFGNNFKANKALKSENRIKTGIGGCIYLTCKNCLATEISLDNNKFRENSAENFAPTIFSQAQVNLGTNEYISNTDGLNLTSNITGLPLTINISNFGYKDNNYIEEQKFFTERVVISGASFDFQVFLYDSFNQPLIISNFSFSQIKIYNNSESKIWVESLNSTLGSLTFKNIKVNSPPNSTLNLSLEIDFKEEEILPYILESNPANNLTQVIPTFVRPCKVGELFIKGGLSCELCQKGEYSLINPSFLDPVRQKCSICPPNANCSGGNSLTPIKGFWRAQENSTKILECHAYESCIGNSENLESYTKEEIISGRCAPHHSGPLCHICEKGYARIIRSSPCEECATNMAVYFKTFLSIILLTIYILIIIKKSLQNKSSDFSNILLKQLMTHLQQIAVINISDFSWVKEFKDYITVQQYMAFISEELFSYDCIFQDVELNLVLKKVVIAVLLPVFLTLCFSVFLISLEIFKFIKTRQFGFRILFSDLKICLLLLVYILYPEVLRKCFSLLECIEIDDYNHKKVLRYGTDVECWTDNHRFYILIIGLPGFIIWGLIYPIGLFLVMYKRKKKMQESMKFESLQNFERENVLTTEAAAPLQIVQRTETSVPKEIVINTVNTIESPINRRKIAAGSGDKSRPINASSSLYYSRIQNQPRSSNAEELLVLTQNLPIKNRELGLTLNFIYKGYKEKYYFWELIIFIKKMLLIFIASFNDLFPTESRATILIVVLSLFLLIQMRWKPYELKSLNQIEYYSLLSSFLSANLGILLYSDELKNLDILILGLITFLNFAFLVFWIYIVIRLTFKSKKKAKK